MKEFLDIAIPLVTFFLMFVVGIDVTIRDFAEAMKRPIVLAIGMTVQVIMLPAIATSNLKTTSIIFTIKSISILVSP